MLVDSFSTGYNTNTTIPVAFLEMFLHFLYEINSDIFWRSISFNVEIDGFSILSFEDLKDVVCVIIDICDGEEVVKFLSKVLPIHIEYSIVIALV